MSILHRLMGLFAIIPISLLLTVSFFVLVTVYKAENKALKAFGYVIAALLWVAVILVFSAGLYVMITGKHPLMEMMQMKGQMMPPPMMNR
jgi:hypothetical protein